jgi:hypothetical protein
LPPVFFAGRGDDSLPFDARPGIEVEHQAVGFLQVVDGRTAQVNFQRARLHQRDQPIEAVDRNRLVAAGLADNIQVCLVDAGRHVFLEEALPGHAVGAAHQCQHPSGRVRPHPVPDLRVVVRQHMLGDAGVLPIDPVGMGERHAGDGDGFGAPAFRAARRCSRPPTRCGRLGYNRSSHPPDASIS